MNFLLNDFLDKDFILFARKKNGEINGMTCGWATEGILFNKHVITLFVRESRYTHEFISEADEYFISVVDDRELLKYFGSVSGRDEDKIKKSGFSFKNVDGKEILEQGIKTINLKKVAVLDMGKADYLDEKVDRVFDEKNRGHRIFVGEVKE